MSSNGGTLVLVVGPSGAGKDSVLRYAARRLGHDPAFMFPRRVITRPANAEAEDHDSLSVDAFNAVSNSGGFAFAWDAHGLKYGIPKNILDDLAKDCVVSINVSRTIIDAASEQYRRSVVVEVEADPELRASRIAGRGREGREETLARKNREVKRCSMINPSYTIVNDGPLDAAGEAFCALLRQFKSS